MPINRGKDSKGAFYRWGSRGKKYYYKTGDSQSRTKAYNKAKRQMMAIFISKNKKR